MSMIETAQAPTDWITSAEAVRRTGMSRVKLYRLAASGFVKTANKPGLAPKYSAQDVAQVCRQTGPAGA